MLLRYGARNFCCFKEGVEISFELSSQCPNDISKGNTVANLMCVKGANGSGKTNALKILSAIKVFCTDSFNYKPDEAIPIDSFFHNDKPVDLYCEFDIEGTVYNYEASVTNKQVVAESLTRTVKREIPLFVRKNNRIKESIKEFAFLENIKLRSNASIISTAFQYDPKRLRPIYDFFNSIVTNVYWAGRIDGQPDFRTISEHYANNEDALKFAEQVIRGCDLGVEGIEIQKAEDDKGKAIFFPHFIHDADVENNKLLFFEESSGTRELFTILPYYFLVLNKGGMLALDEFDINFHPHILPILIQFFDNQKVNQSKAQMIFTSHSSSIMEAMSKYRTIIVNKEKSESFAYRLDEVGGDVLRNDRPIAPVYNSGKIGGVPKVQA